MFAEPAPLPVSAAARAADTLRDQIIEGRFRSGEALRESQLAGSLGVSRNTVREAFRLLSHDGLVEHAPHRGVTVRRLLADDVADIYRIRRAVEQLGLAAVDRDDLHQLDGIVTAAEQAAGRDDWPAVSTGDLRFHQAVVAALRSPRLDAMFVRLVAELRLAFAVMPDLRSFHEPYLPRNRQLVDLLGAGELEAAQGELAGYLDDAEAQLLRILQWTNR